jgi:hypothetical protein
VLVGCTIMRCIVEFVISLVLHLVTAGRLNRIDNEGNGSAVIQGVKGGSPPNPNNQSDGPLLGLFENSRARSGNTDCCSPDGWVVRSNPRHLVQTTGTSCRWSEFDRRACLGPSIH